MNTVHLEHFVAFVECGTRAAAAKKLYTAPQSISKSIQALEREFGVTLIQKSGRAIAPTPTGRRFYEEASEALGCIERLRLIASAGQAPSPEKIAIAIATAPFDSSPVIGKHIEAQNQGASPVELSFLFGPSGSCLSAVEEDVADCALVFGKVEKPGVTCHRLFSLSPTVLMAHTHPLARQRALRFEDMLLFPIAAPTDMRHCRQLIKERFREQTGRSVAFQHVAQGQEKKFFLRESGLMFSANRKMLDSIPSYLLAKEITEEESFAISCFYIEKEGIHRSVSAFVIPRLRRAIFPQKVPSR